MRPLLALFTLPLLAAPALAERTGGGNGGGKGGGALSRVSSGISTATHGSQDSSGGAPSRATYDERDSDRYRHHCYDTDDAVVPCPFGVSAGGYTPIYTRVRVRAPVGNGPAAHVQFFAGAAKIKDSDGSASIELAVTDRRFRLAGAYTHFFERQPGGGVLTMAMPTLMGGFRIDDFGSTAVYLEGGVVHARTNGDAMADSKITGPIAGMVVEHALQQDLSLLGDVHMMWFPDQVKATSGRVGVRYKHVQASLKVLDFNVGPALWGPEVGVSF